MKTLAQLKPGQCAQISQIHGSGALQLRLMELGFTHGTALELRKTAPLGDPLEVHLRNYAISIRRTDASLIEIF